MPIVIAAQVQQAMNQIADKFSLPGGAELARLSQRHVQTNEKLAVEPVRRGGMRMIEGDNVRGAGVAQKRLIEPGDFLLANQVDAHLVALQAQKFRQQHASDMAEQAV